ncbi:MAG: hypothetical protein M3144_01085 [Actinomycetota bacterium]|nr:hypothetical protein [Actinomycetota bacterium]
MRNAKVSLRGRSRTCRPPGLVGLRLNEHALHTWDIDVALDHAATIPRSIAALVVDNLELIGRYTAKPMPGEPQLVTVGTIDPQRRFIVDLTFEGATLAPSDDSTGEGDLEMPAEAFVRLLYGRLDPPTRRRSPATGRCSTGSGPPTPDPDLASSASPTEEPLP